MMGYHIGGVIENQKGGRARKAIPERTANPRPTGNGGELGRARSGERERRNGNRKGTESWEIAEQFIGKSETT
jgi:hypothetical protein